MTPQTSLDLPQSALVLGAAGGIGGAIARKLSQAGCLVLGSDRAEQPEGWSGSGWVTADLADPGAAAQIAASLTGPLGAVVLAAGILDGADWLSISPAEAQRVLMVNLLAPLFVMRAVKDRLEPNASVVVLGSIAGARASPATPIYGASKAGLRNLASSLALLLQPQAVRVNVLAPGLIDTPLTDRLNGELAAKRGISVDSVIAERALPIPAGRAGSSAEMADACLWLLSRQSAYVTGSTLFATGGVMAGSI